MNKNDSNDISIQDIINDRRDIIRECFLLNLALIFIVINFIYNSNLNFNNNKDILTYIIICTISSLILIISSIFILYKNNKGDMTLFYQKQLKSKNKIVEEILTLKIKNREKNIENGFKVSIFFLLISFIISLFALILLFYNKIF